MLAADVVNVRSGRILRHTEGEQMFLSTQAFSDLPFANIQRVTFDRADPATMFVTTFGGSVWRGPVAPNQE